MKERLLAFISEEWINEGSTNRVAYTIALAAVKLPRILKHPILWFELINKATLIKNPPNVKVGLGTISTSYPVGWM